MAAQGACIFLFGSCRAFVPSLHYVRDDTALLTWQATGYAITLPNGRSAFPWHVLLPQELAKFEIDSSNIIVNQVIWPEAAVGSRLLEARVRMQQKYLEQVRVTIALQHVLVDECFVADEG